jgi:hypothetical protein
MSDAADKLAKTRLAIIEQIHRRERRPEQGAESEQDGLHSEARWASSGSGPASWFASLKRSATGWWRQHPAHLGVELVTPILSDYAGR